jgi:hypothetical protein
MKAAGGTGYVVFAHGPASGRLATRCASGGGDGTAWKYEAVEVAFLEGGKPDLAGAVEILAGCGLAGGSDPLFPDAGSASAARLRIWWSRSAAPGHQNQVTAPLDGHPAMVDALLARARIAKSRMRAKLIEWTESRRASAILYSRRRGRGEWGLGNLCRFRRGRGKEVLRVFDHSAK